MRAESGGRGRFQTPVMIHRRSSGGGEDIRLEAEVRVRGVEGVKTESQFPISEAELVPVMKVSGERAWRSSWMDTYDPNIGTQVSGECRG